MTRLGKSIRFSSSWWERSAQWPSCPVVWVLAKTTTNRKSHWRSASLEADVGRGVSVARSASALLKEHFGRSATCARGGQLTSTGERRGHKVRSLCNLFHPHSTYAAPVPNCAIHGTRPKLTKVTVAAARMSYQPARVADSPRKDHILMLATFEVTL